MTTTARLPAPALRRPRTVLVGTLFASASAAMVYFGILAIYVSRRAEARELGIEWFPEGVVELGPSGWIFWTLIMSSLPLSMLIVLKLCVLVSVAIVCSVAHAMLIEGTMETVSKAVLCALVIAATVRVMADVKPWTLLRR